MDTAQEIQKYDPQAAQAFIDAIQKGDLDTAKKIYKEFKETYKDVLDFDTTGMHPKLAEEINRSIKAGNFKTARKLLDKFEKAREKKPGQLIMLDDLDLEEEPSFFEKTLSGDFPTEILKEPLTQFGYELFQNDASQFVPNMNTPVGPDYIVGPGDQFTLTFWGTAEGIFNLKVSKEGTVTLPKVGVVAVAGVRFGEMEHTLRRHLSRYYTNFNISVAMGRLRTNMVYIVGEVTNPGSYSLSSLTTVYGALVSAGGPTKKGTLRKIQVIRSGKVIKTLDLYDFLLRGDRSQDVKLQHEDTVFVPLIGPIAGVAGTVYRPGIYEFKGGESLDDALKMAGGVMPIALSGRIQIARFSDNQKKAIIDIKLPSSSEQTKGATPSTVQEASPLRELVHNMDVLTVLPVYDKVWDTVNLDGDVRHPGKFEWKAGLKVLDIIKEGQLLPTSDLRSAEIIRITSDYMDRMIIPIDLEALLKGDELQNKELQPQDEVRVYTTYRKVEQVTVKGEVLRPGEYEISKGERLSDFLRRVGGFTREAYPYGIVFKRKDVKAAQNKSMQQFISKMQSQILQQAAGGAASAVSTEEAQFAKGELEMNKGLLENLKSMQNQMEGRVALNLSEDIDSWAVSKDDLLLQNGDSILVPKKPQEVLILGEVHSSGAQVFVPELRLGDYLAQSGGATNYADTNQIFVVQANGFAFSSDSPNVGNIEKVALNPGDTIFVPQKVERYAALRFTKDIIDILFKTAVTLATITVIF